MIDTSSRVVRFYLSAEGRKSLRGLVPARGSFQAVVIATDQLGALVYRAAGRSGALSSEKIPVMLLRWDYIASMTFDYQTEGGPVRTSIGFRDT